MVDTNALLLWNKRGVLGEHTLMIARLALIAFVTFILLGISSLVYSYDINIRDAEATLLARSVVNCFVTGDLLDPDKRELARSELENEELLYSVLDYCEIKGDLDRYYVRVIIFDSAREEYVFSQGDSGALWVRGLIKSQTETLMVARLDGSDARLEEVSSFKGYVPGYFEKKYSIKRSKDGGEGINFDIYVEVLVNAEV